jgi:hypothetical protein
MTKKPLGGMLARLTQVNAMELPVKQEIENQYARAVSGTMNSVSGIERLACQAPQHGAWALHQQGLHQHVSNVVSPLHVQLPVHGRQEEALQLVCRKGPSREAPLLEEGTSSGVACVQERPPQDISDCP